MAAQGIFVPLWAKLEEKPEWVQGGYKLEFLGRAENRKNPLIAFAALILLAGIALAICAP
jgi:hypothetical protein